MSKKTYNNFRLKNSTNNCNESESVCFSTVLGIVLFDRSLRVDVSFVMFIAGYSQGFRGAPVVEGRRMISRVGLGGLERDEVRVPLVSFFERILKLAKVNVRNDAREALG